MADIELRNTYTGLDQDYARRRIDAEWEALLRREALQGEPAPGETGEPTTAPTAKDAGQPSALMAGVKAVGETAASGVQNVAGGMFEDRPGQMLYGGLEIASALPAGVGAAVQQAFKNFAPGKETETAIPGGTVAGLLRTFMATPGLLLDPAQAKAIEDQPEALAADLSGPITYGELSNIMTQIATPLAGKGAKKAGQAVKEQAPNLMSERGSIGPSEFRGERTPGDVPKAAPEEPSPALPTPKEGSEARINLGRVEGDEATKAVMDQISRLVGETDPAKTSRQRVTHAETIAAGKEWPLPKLLAVVPEDVRLGDMRAIQQSARDHYTAASTHLADLSKRIAKGDKTADPEFWPAFTVAAKLAELAEIEGTEIGRSLEARKIMAEADRARPKNFTPAELLALARNMEGAGQVPAAAMAGRLASLETAGQRREYLASVMRGLRSGRDLFHELWINNLLTNPATHTANLSGTGLSVTWNLAEHKTAEIINRLFFRDSEGVQRGETAAMLRAIPEAYSDAIRLIGKAWKMETKGMDAAQLSAVEADLLTKGAKLELDEHRLPVALRLPTIALGLEDAAWKGLTFRMELSALALREARAEGKRGQALADRVAELEKRPTAPMLAQATDGAMLLTLNRELGSMGQSFMRWANGVPGGRVIMPFIRTPTNIAKWLGQRAPVLAQISSQNRADLMAGGAARDRAIARQAIGMAVGAAVAWEVANGRITGGGERDRTLRTIEKEERPPYSIRVGDTWYAYARTDPVGGLIGAVADYAEMSARIPTQDEYDEWGAYGFTLAMAVGNVMINKTYMRGLADALDAIKEPDRNAGKVASGFARSLVPAGVRAVTREMDDHIVRDARTLVDSIKAGIPGLSQDIAPDRNPITGEPVKYPPGWGPDLLSPIYITEKQNDPVFEEILANRVQLAPVPRFVKGSRPTDGPQLDEPRNPAFKLTPEERDYWIVAMTQTGTINGRTLHGALTDLVTSEKYREQSSGPGGGRELLIKATYGAFRDKGYALLLERSQPLREALQGHERMKLEKRLPRTDPRSPQYHAPAAEPRGVGGMLQRLTR